MLHNNNLHIYIYMNNINKTYIFVIFEIRNICKIYIKLIK